MQKSASHSMRRIHSKNHIVNTRHFTWIAGIACASAMAFAIHVKYGGFIGRIVSNALAGMDIAKPPYGFSITFIAAITSLLPTIGLFILFMLVYDRIPGKSPLTKGITFGLLRLLSEGQLIRMPLMNAVIGNPLWAVFLQQSETWIINLIVSVFLAYLISFSRKGQGND